MANWWDGYPIGTKMRINGARAVVTKDGPVMVDSDQYRAMKTTPTPNSADLATVKAISDDNNTVAGLAHLAENTMQHNARVNSGGAYGAPVIGGAATWAGGQVNPDLRAMDTNAVMMAKNMRSVGQRLTQMEWQKNLQAVPGPAGTFKANQAVTADIERARIQANAKSSFYQRWLHETGSLAGVDAAWGEFYNKHFSSRGDWQGANPIPPGRGPPPGAPRVGNPSRQSLQDEFGQ